MLDAFLEVAHGKTKQAEARETTIKLLEKLPEDVLRKVASGELSFEKTAYCTDTGETWLEKFQGTPLFDQALEIEKADLQLQMQEAHRREVETQMRAQLPSWDETDLTRQQINIKRKLLELELSGANLAAMGGQEGEDVEAPEAPVDLEAVEAGPPELQEPKPEAPVALKVPEGHGAADVGDTPENDPSESSAGDPPPPGLADGQKPKPKEEKPKTEKTTTVTKEKPVEEKEKIDVKAAAARMRASLQKEAEHVGEVGPGMYKALLRFERASAGVHADNMLANGLKKGRIQGGAAGLAAGTALGAGGAALASQKKEAAAGHLPFPRK